MAESKAGAARVVTTDTIPHASNDISVYQAMATAMTALQN